MIKLLLLSILSLSLVACPSLRDYKVVGSVGYVGKYGTYEIEVVDKTIKPSIEVR